MRAVAEPTGVHSRRAMIRAAAAAGAVAWTAPVIVDSVTSPAAAASCTVKTLNWNSFSSGTTFTSGSVGGVTVTVARTLFTGTTELATNKTIRAAPNGSLATQQALQFQQLPDAVGVGQTIAITFSASVTKVTFALFDIDNLVGGWGDRVSFSGTPATGGPTVGPLPTTITTTNAAWTPTSSHVTGLATSASPLLGSDPNTNLGDSSALGNVTLSFAGPLTAVVFNYKNAVNTGGGNMRIGLGPISFCS